jgi:transcriptional regulator with XRE-family HTH domain
MELAEAIKKLRDELGESQQAFANRLGLSIRAIANYEKDRKPIGKVLVALHRTARTAGKHELAERFWGALHEDLGLTEGVGRKINDCAVGLGLAISYLGLFESEGLKITATQRDALEKAKARLASARATLDSLDPFSITPESEETK